MKYIWLYVLGIIAISTLTLVNFTLPDILANQITPQEFKLLAMANPLVMLLFLGTLGHYLAPKLGFSSYLFQTNIDNAKFRISPALICFALTCPIAIACDAFLYRYRTENYPTIPLITRLLYGGIFEEFAIRWGLMTICVYLLTRLKSTAGKSWPYWAAICFSAFMFGAGHLGAGEIFYHANFLTRFLIVFGNFIVGVTAGWLFWKNSLEEAIAYHIAIGASLWLWATIQ